MRRNGAGPRHGVAVPALHQALAPALGVVCADVVAPVRGPRLWWRGPLDVEGLALGALQGALTAANALTAHPTYSIDAARVGAWFASIDHLSVAGRGAQPGSPLSGFFACADGWIRLHGNYPHHAAAVARALGGPDRAHVDGADRARVAAALAALPALAAEERIRRHSGVAAAVRTASTWLASPMGAAVDADPWIRFATTDRDWTGVPLAAAGRPEPPPLPAYEPLSRPPADLSGLRVLDLTRVIAGPTAARFLALLGADVLRIDPPSHPELLDQHLDTSFGKRSAVADLGETATLGRVRDLLAAADVLLTAYRPGALARFGLDPADLAHDHPALAVVAIDAWGDTGPWGRERGFDSVVQAATGIADVYGRVDAAGTTAAAGATGAGAATGACGDPPHPALRRAPGALPVQALDHATGYGAAAAALALVHRRMRTGRAGSAHLSLAGTAHVLLRLPSTDPGGLEPPVVRGRLPSPYGEMEYAAPAVVADGRHVDYPRAPGGYGADSLAWAGTR